MRNKEMAMCPRCEEMMDRTEKCVKEHPGQAALVALGGGFLLAQFPVLWLLRSLLRLVFFLLKPAAIFYGIYRWTEDMRAQNMGEEPLPPNNGAEI